MAAYTIEINESSSKAKHFLQFIEDYAKDNKFLTLEKIPNSITRKAIDDARKGKTMKAKSAKSLFESI
jgi:hypothetical protein